MSDEVEQAGTEPTNTSEETQTTEAVTPEESGGTLLTGGAPDAGKPEEEGDGEKAAADESGGEDGGDDAPDVPEEYEFKAPEGVEVDKELAEAITPILQKYKFTQEMADEVNEIYANHIQKHQEASIKAFETQLDTWVKELKTDPEIGGEHFAENAGIAAEAVKELGSPELFELLDTTGVGNHPALFKFVLKVGKELAEDQPGSGATTTRVEKQDYEKLYPNMVTENPRRI